MEKKTSVLSNVLIWFGAGFSIAEILTGTYYAPLGLERGLLAIITGHLIGGVLMFLAGLIGAKEEKSSMETVKLSFGDRGAVFFVIFNVIQLMGWTSIMIYDGALAINSIFSYSITLWSAIIGILIIIWIIIGISNITKLNAVSVIALCILSVLLLFKIVFSKNADNTVISEDTLSFGAAVELAVAMPLSWLPLISDYTKKAQKPVKATFASVMAYNIVSIFMYLIGMFAAIYTGGGDIATIMIKAGVGMAGLVIIVISTVTTTYLDAYSAGVSLLSVSEKINEKIASVTVTVIGIVLACIFNMDNITNFLYFIGSVFAPMIAVQIANYYILGNTESGEKINIKNLIVWLIGFLIYRKLMITALPLGSTLADIIFTIIIFLFIHKVTAFFRKQTM